MKIKQENKMKKEKLNLYMAFDIGCLECWQESRVIGLYTTNKEAREATTKAWKEHKKNVERGDHSHHCFKVFKV